MKISIFGSCVTRDVYRVAGITNVNFNYHARTSVISQMSRPVLEFIDKINLESGFQKRMVMNDVQKGFNDTILDSEILIIDFVDERFDLVRYGDSYLLRSVEFLNSGLEASYRFEKIPRFQEPTHKLWESSLEIFVSRLVSIIPVDRIVLHEAYWADSFLNQDGVIERFDNPEQIKKNNAMLKRYYERFKSFCPGLKIVSSKPIGDVRHTWGKSPVHYTDAYYLDIYQQLIV